MIQDNSINTTRPAEEYDLSMLDDLSPKEYNLKDTLKEVFFYILPIFSFVVFILILFLAIIPNISDLTTKLADIDDLKVQDKALTTRIENINKLNDSAASNQDVIDKINQIVPTGQTEVTKFAGRIMSSITANDLKYSGIASGEEVVVSSGVTVDNNGNSIEEDNTLSVRKIPSKFNIKGSFENIRKFFIQLYKGQDFFVVDSMSLVSNGDFTWSGEISLAKYQMSESSVFDPIIAYGKISEKAELNDLVVNFIKSQFLNVSLEKVAN